MKKWLAETYPAIAAQAQGGRSLKDNNAIADALADLGRPEEIGKAFAGFRKYLYAEKVA